MSVAALPSAGLLLHGIAQPPHDSKQSSTPAILFKLSEDLLADVKKASSVQGGLQFVTGNTAKIRLGQRTIDLSISPEAFQHELYSASTESAPELDFAGIISHRAELKPSERKQSIGSDAALAALQNSLASYKQEKEAKSVNISNNVVAEPRNRWEAAREQKQARRRGLLSQQAMSPSMGSSSASLPLASNPSVHFQDAAARMRAMKTPLIHLLAMKPLSKEDMMVKTRIPKDDLEEILGRIGKQEQGKWQLTDRTYKELDVWKFDYPSQEDRQAAVDNAIRAYDRLRLGKDEKLWQQLLPKEDRDKGIVLSKLYLAGAVTNRNNTPNTTGSPLLHGDGGDESVGNTPQLGPSSNPKSGTGKNEGSALTKRLFAKDPKKQRAAEEAKDRKRKDKDVTATSAAATAPSDREGAKPPPRKRPTTKANNSKVKSAEMVYSSSEDSERETKGAGNTNPVSRNGGSQRKQTATERKPATNAAKLNLKPAHSNAANNSADNRVKTARPKPGGGGGTSKTGALKVGTPLASTSRALSSSTTKTSKPVIMGKNTPNGLAATLSQSRTQRSPSKPSSRPTVPSPLGAARPRVASDVSDRGVVGVQRARQGADTPKGLGITNAVKKRQDQAAIKESSITSRSERVDSDHSKLLPRKPVANGSSTSKAPLSNGITHKGGNGVKRKAMDSPAYHRDHGLENKHRKTESLSCNSQKSSGGAGSSSTNMHLERSTSSDSGSSIMNEITFHQGVSMAQKFRDIYYPQYAKLYDEQAAMEKRGETVMREERQRLWDMHRRLEQMKREIRASSQREHLDE